MKKMIGVVTLLVALLSLSACNTVQGVGKDVQQGGKAIQRVATK